MNCPCKHYWLKLKLMIGRTASWRLGCELCFSAASERWNVDIQYKLDYFILVHTTWSVSTPENSPDRSFTVINASCRCCFMCLGEFQSRQAGCSDGEALLWSLIKNCELYIHHALVSGSLKSPRLLYAPSFLLSSSSFLLAFVHLAPRFLTVMKVAVTSYHQNH